MAQLDDPFSDRPAALAAADLDEARLHNLVESWRVRLEGDTQGELGERYTMAYSAHREALHVARKQMVDGTETPADARFLSKDALGFREESALVGRQSSTEAPSGSYPSPHPSQIGAPSPVEPSGVFAAPGLTPEPPPPVYAPAPPVYAPAQFAPPPVYNRPSERLAGTADISSFVPRVALPFSRGADSAPAHPLSALPPAAPKVSARIDSGTTDITAVVRGLGIPFPGAASNPPPAHLAPPPAPPERPKRLIRFDPQTGHPLPAPIWVDIPEDPKK